jgi:predicted kinase
MQQPLHNMEAVIFCGIQASGKSSFYKEHFFRTHMRLSLDMLNTRNKEDRFLDVCLQTQQRFVIDNTNPTAADRSRYIALARSFRYKVVCYYFQSSLPDAVRRNSTRQGKELIAEIGIRSTYSKLQIPAPAEGFDELYYVSIADDRFLIKPWQDDL